MEMQITLFNNGEFFRDLIYVSDVISALEIIMKKGKSGNLYWISSGKKTWFYKFGKILSKKYRYKSSISLQHQNIPKKLM